MNLTAWAATMAEWWKYVGGLKVFVKGICPPVCSLRAWLFWWDFTAPFFFNNL